MNQTDMKNAASQREFSRTRMLIGADGLDSLQNSCVAVFGIGGVGSYVTEALARSGTGCLILIDNDTVDISNINRQLIACQSTIGQPKTQVMKKRILDINPYCRVITFEEFILPDNLESFFDNVFSQTGSIDYIVDAIDTVSAKLALAEYAWKQNIPLIASMGTGNKLHPELFELADINKTSVCPLCKVMRKELKKRGIPRLDVLYSKEEPIKPSADADPGESPDPSSSRRAIPGSISFVPSAAGLIIAGKVIRSLCGIERKNTRPKLLK